MRPDRPSTASRGHGDRALELVVVEGESAAAAIADNVVMVLTVSVYELVTSLTLAELEDADKASLLKDAERAVDARGPGAPAIAA
ncbi:unannotated protein [freshwater metagenome]|uniref:Unannotated protein n=1 Tax=freshwater metagenome TaxID=449393 RepID=A0A6J7EE83_9ZZZZ